MATSGNGRTEGLSLIEYLNTESQNYLLFLVAVAALVYEDHRSLA